MASWDGNPPDPSQDLDFDPTDPQSSFGADFMQQMASWDGTDMSQNLDLFFDPADPHSSFGADFMQQIASWDGISLDPSQNLDSFFDHTDPHSSTGANLMDTADVFENEALGQNDGLQEPSHPAATNETSAPSGFSDRLGKGPQEPLEDTSTEIDPRFENETSSPALIAPAPTKESGLFSVLGRRVLIASRNTVLPSYQPGDGSSLVLPPVCCCSILQNHPGSSQIGFRAWTDLTRQTENSVYRLEADDLWEIRSFVLSNLMFIQVISLKDDSFESRFFCQFQKLHSPVLIWTEVKGLKTDHLYAFGRRVIEEESFLWFCSQHGKEDERCVNFWGSADGDGLSVLEHKARCRKLLGD